MTDYINPTESKATTYIIKITTDNAAFTALDGEPDVVAEQEEVARVLRRLVFELENDDVSGVLRDSNGNVVGRLTILPEEDTA